MTDKARSDTDHFFGQNNDIIHGEVSGNHQHDKSEIHKQIEHHLGKEIPHEDYRSGLSTDKHLDKALNDKDRDVRKTATRNPNATKENLTKALNDEDDEVKEIAKKELENRK